MRLKITFAVAAGALVLALGAPAQAFDRENPDGVGIYSPLEPPVRGRERALRYDPRSWYYKQRGYYPSYSSELLGAASRDAVPLSEPVSRTEVSLLSGVGFPGRLVRPNPRANWHNPFDSSFSVP